MRINTNIASLNAQAYSTQTNMNLQNSLEKLSSGLRINKAADDASGMAIADKLRTQASSIGQGISNANSGSALIQIADAAMGEQSNILDIVKTKLIQASTSTTSAEGREAIRKDVQKLLNQLDNISSQTNYNGVNLLDKKDSEFSFQVGEDSSFDIGLTTKYSVNTQGLGSAGAEGTSQATIKVTAGSINIEGEASGTSFSVKSTGGSITLTGSDVATGSLVGESSFNIDADNVTGLTAAGTIGGEAGTILTTDNAELKAFLDAEADKNTNDGLTKVTSGTYTLRGTGTGTSTITFDNGVAFDIKDLNVSNLQTGTTTAESDSIGFTTSDTVKINKLSGTKDVNVTGAELKLTIDANTSDGLDYGTTGSLELHEGTAFVESSVAASGFIALNTVDGAEPEIMDMTVSGEEITSISVAMTAGTSSITLSSMDAKVVNKLDELLGGDLTKNIDGTYTLQAGSANTNTKLDFGSEGINIDDLQISGVNKGTAAGESETVYIETSSALRITNNSTAKEENYGDFNIQTATSAIASSLTSVLVGASSNEGTAFRNLEGLLTLGEGDLTASTANNFMTVIDDAMTQLNIVRSDFGSTQNQLTVATRNLMTTQVNIKAAESVIRDVDYAAESANFNKQNIISQAGTYAMSQANQVQQNVLRLLQ